MATYAFSDNSPTKAFATWRTRASAPTAPSWAKKVGAKVIDLFWTLGSHDVVLIMEAPDDETMAVFGLNAGKLDNVRTETLRTFIQCETKKILSRMV